MSDPDPLPIEDLLGDVSNSSGSVFYDNSNPPDPRPPAEEWSPSDSSFLDDDTPQQPIGDGTCAICGAPTFRPPGLYKSGRRKRVPKYCDVHNPASRKDEVGPSTLNAEMQRVQAELSDEVKLFGMMVGPFLPVTGYYTIENADPFTVAFTKLCLKNNKALKFAYKVAQVAPLYEFLRMIAGEVLCVRVDTQHLDPHDTVGQWLGVAHAYDAVYPNVSSDTTTNITNNGFRPPPRYAPAA